VRCHSVSARLDWREQIAARGYDVSLLENPAYWIEASEEPFCAVFSRQELDDSIDRATRQLTKLALELVEEVCCSGNSEHYFDQLQTPPQFRECIRRSWKRNDQSLYGRFDFAYSDNSLKLLELNFDTPTSLYESAHLQRMWLEDMRHTGQIPFAATQHNSIQEKLIACLRMNFPEHPVFHLGTFEHAREETENLKYLQSCANQGGLQTQFIYLDDVRFEAHGQLVDMQRRPISCLFKLFPWELIFAEDLKSHRETGNYIFSPLVTSNRTTFVEPAWKSILSNKGALPLLWDLANDRQFLLHAKFDNGSDAANSIKSGAHVRKPLFGREGAGITLTDDLGQSTHTAAANPDQGQFVVQSYAPLSEYRDFNLVIGSWVIGDEPAGVSVRADRSKITGRNALFVPHYVVD
jgi:glutathionylspermidine synthase